MAQDNKGKPEGKKGIPGGFLILLLTAFLFILTLQNLSTEKRAKVGFSYQVEHLVNLDLIVPEESRKVALNDNLVTFSGKFRAQFSNEGKDRYRFLQLLNRNEELKEEKTSLQTDLNATEKQVREAGEMFLALSGIKVSAEGYAIVDDVYDAPQRQNAITLVNPANKGKVSLAKLQERLQTLNSPEKIQEFAKDLQNLILGFKSPVLGIADEGMKNDLKELESKVAGATPETALSVYGKALESLSQIASTLNTERQGIRLASLRSVRNYKQQIAQFASINEQLDKNRLQLDKAQATVAGDVWYFNNQELSTTALEKQNPEAFAIWFAAAKKEWEKFADNKNLSFKVPDQSRNKVLDQTFRSEEPAPNYISYFITFLPVILVVLLLYFVFARQMKGVGTNAMNFGKSPAKLLTKDKNKVTFKDVAGCDEAKEELKEIVDFLKDPAKFTVLGARIPKGVLCIGAPGTGKTLIAKAVAGEADRPFFSISGSDFVEMFVGVGASRIRDLFDQAKKNAPCIIFIDEIDAVGRHRGAGIGGGHDEREQTLNQLLVEMDGFDTNEGVILIAATNRPDVLDKALLRPGRFDRRIIIDLPDLNGRLEILKVHARRIKLDPSVDLMYVAKNTPGSSGADLANILNEAALLAARRGRGAVTMPELVESCDKVKYGKERRSLDLDLQEKKTTAYHEAGHAVVGLVVEHGDPVDKVTIIPRGLSLGATHFLPEKTRVSYWKKELFDILAVAMGGRAAEEIFIGDICSGARQDISHATSIARSMICEWGMNSSLGLVAYDERSEQGQYLGMSGYKEKNYSEQTAEAIDKEVKILLDEAYQRALNIITTNKDKVQLMTDMLLEFETLDRQDVLEIMNGQWDTEKKRQRVQASLDLQRKQPPTPPTLDKMQDSYGELPPAPQNA